jgi:hypothetical protein
VVTNCVPLDNIDHADLRIALRYGADVGDAVNQVLVFPTEFEQVQRDYPILFRRDDRGGYYAVALLGLDRDENLFLDDGRWDARYVPAIRQRGPFTGAEGATPSDASHPAILIDLDDPRVGTADGEALFLRHGGQAPYLDHVSRVLDVIGEGYRAMGPTYRMFADAGLFHATAIEVEVGDGQRIVIDEIHVVTQERLAMLDGATLERLARNGMLHAAHMAAASIENINHLIVRRQRRAGAR